MSSNAPTSKFMSFITQVGSSSSNPTTSVKPKSSSSSSSQNKSMDVSNPTNSRSKSPIPKTPNSDMKLKTSSSSSPSTSSLQVTKPKSRLTSSLSDLPTLTRESSASLRSRTPDPNQETESTEAYEQTAATAEKRSSLTGGELKVVLSGTNFTHHTLIIARREGGNAKQQGLTGTYRWYRLRRTASASTSTATTSTSTSISSSPSSSPLSSPSPPSLSSAPPSTPVLVKESLESEDSTYECHIDDVDFIIACQFIFPSPSSTHPPSTLPLPTSSTSSPLTEYGLIIPDPVVLQKALSRDHFTVLNEKEDVCFLTTKRTKLLISDNEEEVLHKFPFSHLQFHLVAHDSTQFRLVERKDKKTLQTFRGVADSIRGRDMIGLIIRHKKMELLGGEKIVIFSPNTVARRGEPAAGTTPAVTLTTENGTTNVVVSEGESSGLKVSPSSDSIDLNSKAEDGVDEDADAAGDADEDEDEDEAESDVTETGNVDQGYHANLMDELKHFLSATRQNESAYLQERQRDIAQLRLSKQQSSDEIQQLKRKNHLLTEQLTRVNAIPGMEINGNGEADKIAKLNARIKQLSETEKQLRAEIAKSQLQLNQTQVVAVKVETAEAEQNKLAKELEKQETAYAELETKYQKLKQQESDFQARELEVKEIKRARAEYDRERREKEGLRASLAELTSTCETLSTELSQTKQLQLAAEAKNASLLEQHQAMEVVVAEYKKNEDDLIANRNYLKKKADSLAQQIERLLREQNVDVELLKYPPSAATAYVRATSGSTSYSELTTSGSSASGEDEESYEGLKKQNKELSEKVKAYKKQFGALKTSNSSGTGNSLLDKVVHTLSGVPGSRKTVSSASPISNNLKANNVQVSPNTSLNKPEAARLANSLLQALTNGSPAKLKASNSSEGLNLQAAGRR